MGAFKRKDLKMKKFECDGCVHRKCTADVEQSEIPKYCTLKGYLAASWHEVKEEQKLPKLTAEVFDRLDCPKWANYASVNADGKVWFHARKPKIVDNFWCAGSPEKMYQRHKEFDAFDWKNSLVKRPAKEKVLPDWCKVEAVGYFDNSYFRIEHIDDNNDVTVVFFGYKGDGQCKTLADYMMTDKEKVVQARKRKFNDKEMKEIVGKSLETPSFVKFIYSYDKENGTLESHDFLYTAEDLFEDDFKFNGKPCYKLEHLNEKGEWVE